MKNLIENDVINKIEVFELQSRFKCKVEVNFINITVILKSEVN